MAALSALKLERIPASKTLQAWNAADELAIKRLAKTATGQKLLVNDAFGALALTLSDSNTDWWSDSAMAEAALMSNAQGNGLPLPRLIAHPDQLRQDYECIILQVPKSLDLFRWQLGILTTCLAEDGALYALGMVKHLSTGHQSCMAEFFDQVEPGHAEKKARCVRLTRPRQINTNPPTKTFQTPNGLILHHEPGCFSSNRLDPGARVLLETMNQWPDVDRLVDLGCGNGVLALSYLKNHPEAEATLVDESRQAVHSAKWSARANGLNDRAHCRHYHGLKGLNLSPMPLILCNPPFHQATTLTEDIALHLFREARQALSPQGELWVVANRHLPYFHPLKRLFSRVECPSSHPKFVVYRCY